MKPPRSATIWLTLAAGAVLAVVHLFPGRSGLVPADFTAGGPDALEFCDPTNPRFLPVVARASPVLLELAAAKPAREGEEVRVTLALQTASGRPVGAADLRESAGGKLRLWLVDPALRDFRRAALRPEGAAGHWSFSFRPAAAGVYRVFADFTPAVTEREMYVSADLAVAAAASAPAGAAGGIAASWQPTATLAGFDFTFTPSRSPVYARQAVTLTMSISRAGGGMVPLVPLGGAFAQLVAFDGHRTGFANLAEDDPKVPPDPFHPRANFRVTFADPGRYVLWSTFDLAGKEMSVPFGLTILP